MTPKNPTLNTRRSAYEIDILEPSLALRLLVEAIDAHRDVLDRPTFAPDPTKDEVEELLPALDVLNRAADTALISLAVADRCWEMHTYDQIAELTSRAAPTVYRWAKVAQKPMETILREAARERSQQIF